MPTRTWTGDTLSSMDEKPAQSPTSPADTDTTFLGDAIIEIAEEDDCAARPSSQSTRSSAQSAQTRRLSLIWPPNGLAWTQHPEHQLREILHKR